MFPECLRKFGRQHSLLKIECALLVIAVLSPLWVMPFSTPVVADVVVVMHHDSAASTAVRTITENVPDVQVVEYGSLEYALTIHRTFGRVVWVSHGSEKGILAGTQILSWRVFSSRTEITPGKDIILACDSREINKYISTTSVVGFTGPVDATAGGLIVSFLLAPQDSVLKTTYEHIVEIARGMVGPEFLDLSLAEITYWTAIFFLSILAYYSSNPLVVENPTWVQLVVHFLSENAMTNSPSIVLTLVYLLLGQIDVWVAVWQIIAFVITDVPAAFGQMLTDSEVMNDQLFIATIVLALAMIGLGLFYGRLSFDLALLLAGIVFIFGGVVIDFNDDNDWVG